MDLLIPDNWLREFLDTDATNKDIAKCLSLCGPSVESVQKISFARPRLAGTDYVYHIEVTTNRMDTASVYGIAREASVILPRFNKKAKLMPLEIKNNFKFVKKVKYLNAIIDPKLCSRFTAVLIKNVKIGNSPKLIQDRLVASGIRPINNVVDISNYIMLEIGQPVHTFDYDKLSLASQGPGKIKGQSMLLRESNKGEKIATLDNKKFTLPGGDVVIEDGKGRLIDLCGIMGGALSAVDEYTKNVLLFVQNYDTTHIRKTSMHLAQRTMAASLFEKGIDPELVKTGIIRAINMFIKLTNGVPENEILDIYASPYKEKIVKTTLDQINKKLGIEIAKTDINEILTHLGFNINWNKDELKVIVPSFRSSDINIPEDITEEIARIYGYHNFPSVIMSGVIPSRSQKSTFSFEDKIKDVLKGYGGIEVYTLSLTIQGELKLKNPLTADTEYLRTTLMDSLISAAKNNAGEKEPYHLFEIANVYLPSMDLPEERMTLAGIFANTNYRESKGVIESLLDELNIKADFVQSEMKGFLPGQRTEIIVKNKIIGQSGNLENTNYTYYEFDIKNLDLASQNLKKYIEIPQKPPQIEDLTLVFPEKTKIGEVINTITSMNRFIAKVELRDIFKDSYTFRIWYQDPNKTLTDSEVEQIRNKILQKVKEKFGGTTKE